MLTNTELIKFAEKAIGREYWWGTFGNKATESLLAAKRKQYPNYYNQANYKKPWTCNGQPVFDCIGLIKAFVWCNGEYGATPKYNASQDVNVGGMLNLCKEKGKINTIPEVPGVLLFKTGHVGIYIGDGMMIHAAGHDRGVVKEKYTNVKWTDWGKCPWITYENKTTTADKKEEKKPESTPNSTAAVDDMSNAILEALKNIFTHKVKKAVNVRAGHGVTYKRIMYKDFPEYIKSQMKAKDDCLNPGIKIICFDSYKGWYKIDDKKDIWIAGNYTTKL